MDTVVDHYFPVLEKYGETLEGMEDKVFLKPDTAILTAINEARHDLLALRRVIWPLRGVMTNLLNEDISNFTTAVHPFVRDCQDHVNQAMDLVETYREVCSFLSEVYLSSVSNRMNEVMRVLTLIATIFIPLTFIAGIYGMNFKPEKSPWNMPEIEWYWGYPAVILVMVAVAVLMVVYFKKKKWL